MPRPVRLTALSAVAGLVLALAPASMAQTQAPAAPAASDITLSLEGSVAHPRVITAAELEALPPTTVEIAFETGHGPLQGRFTGALLWGLLESAGLVDEPGPKTHLRHVVLVRGRDGYAVALSVGELDPGFEGKPVILAYAQDGKPLQELRLVVPNDKHAGRSVRDVVAVEVR